MVNEARGSNLQLCKGQTFAIETPTVQVNNYNMSAETVEKVSVLGSSVMAGLFDQAQMPPKEGDIVEGHVLSLDRAKLYIDLPPFGTGVIFGREYMNAREVIKRVNVGDLVAAKVISTTSKDGYIELSLKEARQAIVWAEAEEAVKGKKPNDPALHS